MKGIVVMKSGGVEVIRLSTKKRKVNGMRRLGAITAEFKNPPKAIPYIVHDDNNNGNVIGRGTASASLIDAAVRAGDTRICFGTCHFRRGKWSWSEELHSAK